MRNKLIHDRATVGVTDGDVQTYRQTVESVLKILFGCGLAIEYRNIVPALCIQYARNSEVVDVVRIRTQWVPYRSWSRD